MQDHLTVFAESLNKARALINPPAKKASKLGDMLPVLAETVDKEHKRLLARKSIIEKRKEEQERQLLEMVFFCDLLSVSTPFSNLWLKTNSSFLLYIFFIGT